MGRQARVCLGIIVGAHGVRGAVRIKSFTANPADVAAYGALTDEAGARQYALKLLGQASGTILASLGGVADRNAAEQLRGTRLYVARDRLPALRAGEFYQADLIGLAVEDKAGAALGRVSAVHNFGAGDILEIETANGRSVLLPFREEFAPTIDLAAGRLVADPPQGIFDE